MFIALKSDKNQYHQISYYDKYFDRRYHQIKIRKKS